MRDQRQTFLEKLAGMVEPVTDAAEILGISRQRVHQLIEAGDLKAVKIGKQFFVDTLSLQERLEAKHQAGHSAAPSALS